MTRRVSEIEELYIAAASGIADSGTTTTLVDADRTEDDDAFNDMILCIIGGTNKGQSRRITDFVKSTHTITVSPAFTKAIDNTSEYIIKHFVVAAAAGGDATLAKQNEILEDIVDIKGTGFVKDSHSLKQIKDAVDAISITPADIWTYATRTLTDPDSYKADVSALALEATLTAIKGAGWSAETLKAIYDAMALASVCTEARLSKLDAAVSSRSSHSEVDVRQSVCLGTDPVDSIGRLMFDRVKAYLTAEVARHSIATEARLSELDAANLPADVDAILTDTADIQPRVPRIVCHMDFWSDNDDEIALTTTAGADHNLPNCVVAGLPTGITIIRVVAMLKIALIKDTSGSDNAINGATALKVDAASDYSSTVTAIDIPDNSWAVDVSEATERGGDVMIGDNDIKTEVTGNATFYARLEDIVCDGNNLKLKDIAWGLRIYFTV